MKVYIHIGEETVVKNFSENFDAVMKVGEVTPDKKIKDAKYKDRMTSEEYIEMIAEKKLIEQEGTFYPVKKIDKYVIKDV